MLSLGATALGVLGTLAGVTITEHFARERQREQRVADVEMRKREWQREDDLRRLRDRQTAYANFLACLDRMAEARYPGAFGATDWPQVLPEIIREGTRIVQRIRMVGSPEAMQAAGPALALAVNAYGANTVKDDAVEAAVMLRERFLALMRLEAGIEPIPSWEKRTD